MSEHITIEPSTPNTTVKESSLKIFLRFLRFGLLAWGGPVAQIAMIRRELVEEEKWISKERFNRALAVYQVLPGPEAHEMCVYFGMIAGGRWGGFLAGLGFMLPGFIFMLLLTWFYIAFGIKSPLVLAVFTGFQAAVIALIVAAVHRIGKHAVTNYKLGVIAAVSAVTYFAGVHFLLILPFAGAAYIFWMRKQVIVPVLLGVAILIHAGFLFSPELFQSSVKQIAGTTASGFHQGSPWQIFISGLKGGLLTFGGAYTVIPFMQQDAVTNQHWMTNEQFLDGFALSGILPAPLIIFSTFIGYFGGGWIGAVIITFAIFLPSFAFTLVGFNVMERIISNTALHNFLDGVTAGVIGIIAITALQLFRTTINDWFLLAIFAVSLFVIYKYKTKFTVIYVILGSGILSLLWFQLLQ